MEKHRLIAECDPTKEIFKHARKFPSVTTDLHKFTTLASLAPTVPHDIDHKKVDALIGRDPEHTREIIQKVVQNTHYVPWKEFVENLQSALSQFLSEHKQPYILLLIEPSSDKSGYWTTLVAYRILQGLGRPPVTVCSLAEAFLEHPDIDEYLVVDDMMYSGQDLSILISTEIFSLLDKFHLHCPSIVAQKRFSFALAGCTAKAAKMLKQLGLGDLGWKTYCGHMFKPLADVLTMEERKLFETHFRQSTKNYPVVFQHKLADYASSFPFFYSQILQSCDPKVGCFVPHYKSLFRK